MKRLIIFITLGFSLLALGSCNTFDGLFGKQTQEERDHVNEAPPYDEEKEQGEDDMVEKRPTSPVDEPVKEEPLNDKGQEEPENTLTLKAIYFNEIEEVNGKKVIQNPENILVLTNKESYLPSGYEPSDLVRPNVLFSFGKVDVEKSYLRKDAASALGAMFAAAKEEDLHIFAVSGYRSYKRQMEILNAKIASAGEAEAVRVIAIPGQSEHQTGLAMDVSSESAGFKLEQSFEQTAEGSWLAKNAHAFGFILRYPKGKEAITTFSYEPWHFRYVGEEVATIIFENNWTLEEYFSHVEKVE